MVIIYYLQDDFFFYLRHNDMLVRAKYKNFKLTVPLIIEEYKKIIPLNPFNLFHLSWNLRARCLCVYLVILFSSLFFIRCFTVRVWCLCGVWRRIPPY